MTIEDQVQQRLENVALHRRRIVSNVRGHISAGHQPTAADRVRMRRTFAALRNEERHLARWLGVQRD